MVYDPFWEVEWHFHRSCISGIPHIRYLYYNSQHYQNYSYEVATVAGVTTTYYYYMVIERSQHQEGWEALLWVNLEPMIFLFCSISVICNIMRVNVPSFKVLFTWLSQITSRTSLASWCLSIRILVYKPCILPMVTITLNLTIEASKRHTGAERDKETNNS